VGGCQPRGNSWVATAAATVRMLQQHCHYLIFAFLHTYQSLAASGSLVGTVTWCTPVNRGTRLFLPPPDIEGPRFRPSGRVKLRTRADGMIAIYSRSAGRGARLRTGIASAGG
jgi:hypothetical protein